MIYLLLAEEDEKNPEWHSKTKENVDLITKQISFFYQNRINTLTVNFGDFKDVIKEINNLIENEKRKIKNDLRILIDITSTPLLPRVALINVASIHQNIEIYYTPPQNRSPSDYNIELVQNDEGKDSIILPIIRSTTFDELKKKKHHIDVLKQLMKKPEKKVQSYSELLDLLNKTKEKKEYMFLGRVVKDLEKMGYVKTKSLGKVKEVELTILGEAIIESLS